MSYNPEHLEPPEIPFSRAQGEPYYCEICDAELYADDVIQVNAHILCDDYQCLHELAEIIDNELHMVKVRVDALVKRLSSF